VGTAVFAGMIGVTILGVFFTPALYVLMQGRKRNVERPGGTMSEAKPGSESR
jgi:HAE1 family hydrophobic/amphiphilic exporter-1